MKIFKFETLRLLSDFLRDYAINVLGNDIKIDYNNNIVSIQVTAPGIDRIDDTAKEYGGKEVFQYELPS